jgi:Ca2+/H+ antiporter
MGMGKAGTSAWRLQMPLWTVLVPAVGLPLAESPSRCRPGPALALVCAIVLCAAVVASVHHAEVVAHRVGEPFGTLILAVAVTVIEVALIVSMMLAGGSDKSGLARDTIFSAIMIVCNGAVGLCVIAGGLKHREQSFRLEGATSALAALIVMAALTLVLPVFTTTNPGPTSIRRRSSPSPRSRRSRSGRCSCSCRRCATATTSCRPAAPATSPSTRRRRRPASPGRASAC